MSRRKQKSPFERLQARRYSNPETLGRRIGRRTWSSSHSGFAAYIAGQPQFRRGSLATAVRTFLKRRRTPASLNDIVTYVLKNRTYKNFSSGHRSVRRVLAQLGNWDNISYLDGKFIWNELGSSLQN